MVDLVGMFGTTSERRAILRGLLSYRALLRKLGYSHGLQLVDGSFVEHVEGIRGRPPGDIDVFSFLDLPALGVSAGSLDATGRASWEDEVADRDKNKARFSVDTYAVLVPELGFIDMFATVNYWTSLFSHQRTTNAWKGFLAIQLDQNDDASATTALDALEPINA